VLLFAQRHRGLAETLFEDGEGCLADGDLVRSAARREARARRAFFADAPLWGVCA
jgi:hypothetical protein